jgi:hypothetical protein
MNDFQMMTLANDFAAERRAEADRHRLARSGRTESAASRPAPRTRRATVRRTSLSNLIHRVAFL